MKRILVFYYSQTGMQKELIDGLLTPLKSDNEYQIDYYKIKPINDFPFPWSTDSFFDAMPESVDGVCIPMHSFEVTADYDLVILGYQVWFLSPSIPFWSFLMDEKVKKFLAGKRVVTVLGVRNMWVNAHFRVRKYFKDLGVNHIANLVFSDPSANLVSVLTVLQYLTTGVKKPFKFLPPYGISQYDMQRLPQFGMHIHRAFEHNSWADLQTKIVENKGVSIEFSLKTTEMAAGRIFKIWSSFVRKKGEAGNPARSTRLAIYKYYLLFLIFFISPVSSTVFKLINVIFKPYTAKGLQRIALLQDNN